MSYAEKVRALKETLGGLNLKSAVTDFDTVPSPVAGVNLRVWVMHLTCEDVEELEHEITIAAKRIADRHADIAG